MRSHSVLASLNGALHRMMSADQRVVLLGEDLLDPYGGAFKVTHGLSTAFPDRVFTTPISEAGFTGVAVGMAMRGLLPIVEIMFGDFLMLAADQLLNHATKYAWMYDDRVRVPLVVRAPMGARRGYGPTHSQSIEKHFLGMPGLVVVAASPYHDPGALLEHAVLHDPRPVLFVENKLMYARPLQLAAASGRLGDLAVRSSGDAYPTICLSLGDFSSCDLTIVTYGGMAELAVAAAEQLLIEHEIEAEVVIVSALAPLDLDPIAEALERSGRLLVCEEATPVASWGSELVSRMATERFHLLRAAPVKVAARNVPIANTRALEEAIVPQVDDIVDAARALAGRSPVRLAKG